MEDRVRSQPLPKYRCPSAASRSTRSTHWKRCPRASRPWKQTSRDSQRQSPTQLSTRVTAPHSTRPPPHSATRKPNSPKPKTNGCGSRSCASSWRRAELCRFPEHQPRRDLQVLHERRIGGTLLCLLLHAQQRGRMDRDQQLRAVTERERFTAHLRDRHRAPHQAARRGRAERHDQFRFYNRALLLGPPAATVDLVSVWLLVEAALAARLELEVLHRIGDEGLIARNAGVGERLIKHPARRPDEWLASEVLLVTG